MNIDEIRSPAEEDDATETVILRHLLALHPVLISVDELRREIADGPQRFAQRDAIERGVRDLVGAGLLHCAGGLLAPSRAAVRFDELLGGSG